MLLWFRGAFFLIVISIEPMVYVGALCSVDARADQGSWSGKNISVPEGWIRIW